jgi:glycosyltransferase involved in cell wall biosynthesis
MSSARITALMPLRHYHPLHLEQSVASLLRQTHPCRVLVVVEPHDHDRFGDVLRQALTATNVRLVANEGRKLAGAINTGMRHAQTDFVAILLADDLWADNAAEVLTSHIEASPEVDFLHSSRRIIDESGKPISSVHYSRASFSLDDFKTSSPVKHLLCWRTSMALRIGGLDESLNSVGPDDYDFPWTMAENGARFRAIEECLYFYRDHRDCFRLTTHLPLSVHKRECNRIFKKHGVGWRDRRRYLARAQQSFMRQCLFRNLPDKWMKELFGYDAYRGWRAVYR